MEIASCPIPSGKQQTKYLNYPTNTIHIKINIGNNDKINGFENKMLKFFFLHFRQADLIIKGSMFIDLSKHLEWKHSQ